MELNLQSWGSDAPASDLLARDPTHALVYHYLVGMRTFSTIVQITHAYQSTKLIEGWAACTRPTTIDSNIKEGGAVVSVVSQRSMVTFAAALSHVV